MLLETFYPCILNYDKFKYQVSVPRRIIKNYEWIDKDELLEIWNNRFSTSNRCVIDKCHICLDDINNLSKFCICKNCRTFTHIYCKVKYFKSLEIENKEIKCEICRCIYNNHDINIILMNKGKINNKRVVLN